MPSGRRRAPRPATRRGSRRYRRATMSFTTRPELRGTFGMVASTHWLASAAGMAVLERGGNAFDAAVATGLTLQVVEPHLNGPGGDLPALLWPAGGDPVVLCAQGPAPRAASVTHYRDTLGLELVPGTGPLAAVVPGAFGGWLAILRDYGTLRLRDVLEYAIGYAEHGFPVLPQIAGAIRNVEQLFRSEWTTSAEVYLPVPAPGALARNRALAATYRRVITEAEARTTDRDEQIEAAHDMWYRGFVAEAMTGFSVARLARQLRRAAQRAAGRARSGRLATSLRAAARGRLPRADSAEGRAVEPGTGLPAAASTARRLRSDRARPGVAEYVHVLTECAKLAFADREAWSGPRLRRRADRRAALPRVRGRAPQAGRRRGRRRS